jgi:UDP-N-acetylglucosamine--N-acetylmuramyl-(pentapeptide) pyrophosphoryl-undecaprenol N-acetylglucosamine transferase
VSATLTAFIDDTAQAFAQADVVIARAGASTVTELAALGVPAIYVPFPHAVDDHQTTNARFVVDAGGGWLMPQHSLTAQALATHLQALDRDVLLQHAQAAYAVRQTQATEAVIAACEALALSHHPRQTKQAL